MPGRFENLEQIERDGWSVVYRAYDRSVERRVSVKRLAPENLDDKTSMARFQREARAIAQVHSPHVLAVYEVGHDAEGPFLCTEPARGECLARRLRRLGALDVEEVERIGVELCDALTAVHRVGLVHGNLGAEHVFLDGGGHVQLTGFGLARQRRIGGIGRTARFRCDLEALGMLLVESLVGPAISPEPAGPSVSDALRDLRPDLPAHFADALRRAVQPRPGKRFASALHFCRALRGSVPPPDLAQPPAGSRSLGWAAAAVVLAFLGVGFWVRFDFPGHDTLAVVAGSERGAEPVGDRTVFGVGYDRSHALIVGIDDYGDDSWTDLESAETDARAVHACLLAQQGFSSSRTIFLAGREATRDRILEVLRDEFSHSGSVGPDDRVVFFFAGHGQQQAAPGTDARPQVGYLVPQDASHKWSSFISYGEILEAFDLIPAKHALLLLDCCFSGLATVRGEPQAFRYDSATRHRVRQVLAAGRPGERVWDGLAVGSGHSPFSHFLLKGLKGDAYASDRTLLTGSELCIYVQRMVVEATAGMQTPVWTALGGLGDFVFLRDP